jgi:hypothetical protein
LVPVDTGSQTISGPGIMTLLFLVVSLGVLNLLY